MDTAEGPAGTTRRNLLLIVYPIELMIDDDAPMSMRGLRAVAGAVSLLVLLVPAGCGGMDTVPEGCTAARTTITWSGVTYHPDLSSSHQVTWWDYAKTGRSSIGENFSSRVESSVDVIRMPPDEWLPALAASLSAHIGDEVMNGLVPEAAARAKAESLTYDPAALQVIVYTGARVVNAEFQLSCRHSFGRTPVGFYSAWTDTVTGAHRCGTPPADEYATLARELCSSYLPARACPVQPPDPAGLREPYAGPNTTSRARSPVTSSNRCSSPAGTKITAPGPTSAVPVGVTMVARPAVTT